MLTRLEHDEVVGDIRRHGVGGYFGRAHFGKYAFDFRECLDGFLQRALHRHRFRQARARDAQRVHGDVTFVEIGHEFAAETSAHQDRDADQDQRGSKDQGLVREGEIEQRTVAAQREPHRHALAQRDIAAHEYRDSCRHEGNRQQHGGEQGRHHGKGHGMEHFPFHAAQCEDREINHDDDQLPEYQCAARLLGCAHDFGQALLKLQRTAERLLTMRQSPHAVLDYDHCAVDDDAEIERAQAHQISTDLVRHHAGEGEQHRQGDDGRRDGGGAQIAEKHEQHHDYQHRAFQQILAYRGDSLIDQHGAVIDGLGDDARRQAAIDLRQSRIDGL